MKKKFRKRLENVKLLLNRALAIYLKQKEDNKYILCCYLYLQLFQYKKYKNLDFITVLCRKKNHKYLFSFYISPSTNFTPQIS